MKKKTMKRLFAAISLALVGAMVLPTAELALFSEQTNDEQFIAYAALNYRLDNLFGGQINKKTTAEKLKEAEEKKKELEAQRDKYQKELDAWEGEYDDLIAFIQEMDEKQGEIQEELLKIEAELTALNADLEQARTDLAVAEQVAEQQYENMKKRLQYIYENGETSYLEILLSSSSLSDLLNQFEYVEKITEYDNKLLKQYIEAKNEVSERKDFLEAQIGIVELTQTMYEEDMKHVDDMLVLKQAAVAEFEEKMGAHEEILEDYLEQIANQELTIDEINKLLEEEIRKQEEEQKKQEAEAGNNKNDYSNVPSTGYNNAANVPKTDEKDPSKMIWPLPGDPYVGDGFGPRVPPCEGASTFHKGVDIGGKSGAQIVAALAGTVYQANYSVSGGNQVYIDHGNGYMTKYLHCSKVYVKKGDYVQQGEVIALCGSTGVSTAPHLHFSVYKNFVPVDPMKYIKY